MTENETTTQPETAPTPAPVPAAQPTGPVASTDTRVVELMGAKAYTDVNDPGHRAAVAAVSERFRELHPDEPSPAEEPSLDELRKFVGVEVTLPQMYESQWDRVAEAEHHLWTIEENVPKSTAQAMINFVRNRHILSAGQYDKAEAIADFHREFASSLTQTQRENRIRAYFSRRAR